MTRTYFRLLLLLPMALVLTACGSKTTPPPVANPEAVPGPVTKPTPPLPLAVPPARPDRIDGRDTKAMVQAELFGRANQAMAKGDYARASTYQYWYVQKAKSGRYNLACFLAQVGETDAALYWLESAALEEGVDAQHAEQDDDLASLRRDARWGVVRKFLADCNRYFESAPIARTILVVPKDYQKGTPIPVVLWLHGLGSRPEDFLDGGQEYADRSNVAFVGVSGTKARGPRSFVWAEDPAQDAKRMRDALAEVADRVTVKKGHVITLGFSQGAQAGLDVAVRYPEEYAGSIVLSPGAEPHLEGFVPSPLLARRGFVLSCGADEHPGNVRLTATDAAWLTRAKARVIHEPYPGVSAHSFPKDFDERFPEWVKFILGARGG